MRALVFAETLQLREAYARPAPGPGEALVKVHLAGICNTDLEIMRGYMGFRGVLGHEFVGVVEAADDAAWVGRRVVGEINCACGECPTCRAGRPTHCPARTTVGIDRHDGVLADYVCLPLANLHSVPEGVSDRQAVFAEPLAAALEIPDQAHVRPSECVVVLGDGKLGLLVAQVLALLGCELVAVGRHPDKLAILARRGIPTSLEAEAPTSLVGAADLVVDCTGKPEGLSLARRLVRPRGRLVLKSTTTVGTACLADHMRENGLLGTCGQGEEVVYSGKREAPRCSEHLGHGQPARAADRCSVPQTAALVKWRAAFLWPQSRVMVNW